MLTFAAKCRKFFCEKINEPFRIRRQALHALTHMQMTPCTLSRGLILKEHQVHRADRVLGFFSNRPIWDPLTRSVYVLPPFGSERGDTLACGRGGGGSQLGRGNRHRGTSLLVTTQNSRKKELLFPPSRKAGGKTF